MCRKIIKSLGLLFGAIDLIYSKDKFYFIEVNLAYVGKKPKVIIEPDAFINLMR